MYFVLLWPLWSFVGDPYHEFAKICGGLPIWHRQARYTRACHLAAIVGTAFFVLSHHYEILAIIVKISALVDFFYAFAISKYTLNGLDEMIVNFDESNSNNGQNAICPVATHPIPLSRICIRIK